MAEDTNVIKRYLKRLDVESTNYLLYEVFQPKHKERWFEAVPLNKNLGLVRVAEDERILMIKLQNDVRSIAVGKCTPKVR